MSRATSWTRGFAQLLIGGWASAWLLLVGTSSQALELRAGDILVTEPLDISILRIDPVTGAKDVLTRDGELWVPIGMDFDADGNVVVADFRSGYTGAVLRVDPETGAQEVVSHGGLLRDPNQVVVGPSGDLFVTAGEGGYLYGEGGVLRIDPSTGAQSFVFEESETSITSGLAMDENGQLIVGFFRTLPTRLQSEVYRLDPETGARQRISYGGDLFSPYDLALEEDGDILVAELIDNLIVRIDPETGAQERVPLDLPGVFTHGVRAIDFESDGSLLVLSSRTNGQGLYRMRELGGPLTRITPLIRPLGMLVVPGRRIPIDIRPGSERNPVAAGSRGVLPVAVLGSDDLDVSTLDPDGLVFGPGHAERVHASGPHPTDVNDDGHLDLLFHFRIDESGIGVGDTQACLSGSALDGTDVAGCDAVDTGVGCGGGFATALCVPLLTGAGSCLRRRRRVAGVA